jgi:hypothetical protein
MHRFMPHIEPELRRAVLATQTSQPFVLMQEKGLSLEPDAVPSESHETTVWL